MICIINKILKLFFLAAVVCSTDEFLCHSKQQCIPKQFVCNRQFDCSDDSDEDNCRKLSPFLPPMESILFFINLYKFPW